MLSNKSKDKYIFFIVNILFFVIMLVINCIYPYSWDDGGIAQGYVGAKDNLIDIVLHTYRTYYLQWSGKLVPLSIVLFFTLVNKMAYNIIGSLMYVLLANIIYGFWDNKKYNYWVLLTIYSSLWIFIPWFGTVIFWIDGSIEYLWMLIPILLLGKIYYKQYFYGYNKRISCVGILLLGLVAGCGLEATGSALVFGLAVMLLSKIVKKKKVEKWEIAGIIGTLMGFASLMLAPGNYKRASVVMGQSSIYNNYLYRIARESYFFLLYEGVLFGVCIALMALLYICNKDNSVGRDKRDKIILDILLICKEPLAFVILALISVYVMTFVSAFAVRIFLTPTVLLIISCLISIRKIGCSNTELVGIVGKYSLIVKIVIISVSLYVVVQMFTAFLFCLYTGDPITKNIQYTNIMNDVRLFN